MSNLSIMVTNAIVNRVKDWKGKDKYRAIISFDNKNIRENDINGNGNTCHRLENILPISELDFLHIIKKEKDIIICSFEVKQGRRSTVSLSEQLLKQLLSLLLVTLDGLYIISENSCVYLGNKPYESIKIEVRYLTGYSEEDIKIKSLSEIYKILYEKSQVFSHVKISRKKDIFDTFIEIKFPNDKYENKYKYYDRLLLSAISTIKDPYRKIIIRSYEDIIKAMIYGSGGKENNKEGLPKIRLSEILLSLEQSYLETLPRF